MPVSARHLSAVSVLCLLAACGQKGPPLPPLHLVPAPVTEVSARRVEDRVRLQFVLPTQNANGPGRLNLARVEIYAVTAAPGVTPPNRGLLTRPYLVGQVEVRPAPQEGEPPAPEGDTRPGPGEVVTFEDVLTPAKLAPVTVKEWLEPVPPTPTTAAATTATTPAIAAAAPPPPGSTVPSSGTPANVVITPPPSPVAPPPDPTVTPPTATVAAPPATPAAKDVSTLTATQLPGAVDPAAQAAAATPKTPVRIYIVRGVSRSGRPGQPSARVQVPMVDLPAPPASVAGRFTETSIVLEWQPPAEGTALAYNVYSVQAPEKPLNPSPVSEPTFEHPMTAQEDAQCYRVRSVLVSGAAQVEGSASEEACVTPRDVFPPAAPKGFAAVGTVGQINLIWEGNTEPDLAGYLVLRAEAGPDAVLQPITPAPIKETSFTDTTVKPGVRYVYAIVAVDSATPPNMSPQSERREETAR